MIAREGKIVIVALKRKILTAILSSLLIELIIFVLDGFEMEGFLTFFYLNLMFAITYGVITSLFSDWVSKEFFKQAYAKEITSFILHCACGLVFTVVGLVSAIAFFIIDRLLVKVKINWLSVIIALLIVVLVYIILINI